MRVLAIDTTGPFGSLAVTLPDRTHEIAIHAPDGFSTSLFDHVDRFLRNTGLTLSQLDAFAAASGPGSFTGVRVGLTAIKALAEALDKPAYAVSNLQALASIGSAVLRAVFLDARRGEIYGAVYDRELRAVVPEAVLKFGDWMASVPEANVQVITTDAAPFRPALANSPLAGAEITETRVLAGAVARIAAQRLAAGELSTALALDANYVRRSDAELLWTDR